MAQAILTSKGSVVPRQSLRKLSQDELISESEKEKRSSFTAAVKAKLGDSVTKPSKPMPPDFIPYSDGNLDPPVDDYEEDHVDEDGISQFEAPVTDYLIHAEVNLPKGEEMQRAKVISRSKSDDGRILGMYDDNPMLNTLLYDVQFPDGTIKEYAANIIAENMFSQVDADGYSHTILEAIVDHKKDDKAVDCVDKYIQTKSGT